MAGIQQSIQHAPPRAARQGRLVLFAHGSRDPSWRATCERIARRVADRLGERSVSLAYMQMAEPTLLQAATAAVESGFGRLTVLPLFFSAGGHVACDVPGLVEEVRREHPDAEVEVAPPVGEDERFSALVADLSQEILDGS